MTQFSFIIRSVGDSPLRQIHNNGDIPYFELSPTSRHPQANQIQNANGKYEELNRTRDNIENQARNRRIEIKENSTYSQGYFSVSLSIYLLGEVGIDFFLEFASPTTT